MTGKSRCCSAPCLSVFSPAERSFITQHSIQHIPPWTGWAGWLGQHTACLPCGPVGTPPRSEKTRPLSGPGLSGPLGPLGRDHRLGELAWYGTIWVRRLLGPGERKRDGRESGAAERRERCRQEERVGGEGRSLPRCWQTHWGLKIEGAGQSRKCVLEMKVCNRAQDAGLSGQPRAPAEVW